MALELLAVRWPIVVRSVIAGLLVAASACFGASTAFAGVQDEDVTLTLDPASVDVDSLFSAVLAGCVDGQNVTFSLGPGNSKNSPCVGADGDGSVGSANAEFLSPEDPGTYTVTGEVLETAATASAQLTVVAAELEAPEQPTAGSTTGSTSRPTGTAAPQLPATGPVPGPTVPLAVAAIAFGLGLIGVARLRR